MKKDKKFYTSDELFGLAANKSIAEIKLMTDDEVKSQAIRYWFNRLLVNYPDETPFKLKNGITLNTNEDLGLSGNDKMTAIAISMTGGEGFINIWIEGCPEPLDIDAFDLDCLVEFMENIEEQEF